MNTLARTTAAFLLIFPTLGRAGPPGFQGLERTVAFVVESPSVPAGAKVCIVGNHPNLGSWNPASVALDPLTNGTWRRALTFEPGARLEFKVSLGSWDTEALNDDGSTPPNRLLEVAEDATVTVRVARWKKPGARPRSKVTGDVRYHRNLEHPGLLPRDVLVWLPPGYESEPETRYPVLYLHDGQQVFDPATSMHGVDWQVDEAATDLIRKGRMRKIIVVAINNTSDRWQEYSDTPKGTLYADFIIRTLKPMIDATYRTEAGPEATAVMGSSMGGRISFLLAWNHPDVFSMAACLSSAFWGDMIREV